MRIRTYPLPDGHYIVLVDRVGAKIAIDPLKSDKGEVWIHDGEIETDQDPVDLLKGLEPATIPADSIRFSPGGIVSPDVVGAEAKRTLDWMNQRREISVQQVLRDRGAKIAEGQVDYGQRSSKLTISPVYGEPLRIEIHRHSDLTAEQIADQVQDMVALHREGNFDAESRPRRVKVDPEPVAYSVVEKGDHIVDGCLHPDPVGAQDCLKSLQQNCRSINDPDPRIVPLYAGVGPATTEDKDISNG